MKKALIFAAVAEAATGLALLVVPSLLGRVLLGEELTGVAIPVARVAGIALIALGVACWPGSPLVGMLIYSASVTLYLAYLGFRRFDRRPPVAGGRPPCDPDGTLGLGVNKVSLSSAQRHATPWAARAAVVLRRGARSRTRDLLNFDGRTLMQLKTIGLPLVVAGVARG